MHSPKLSRSGEPLPVGSGAGLATGAAGRSTASFLLTVMLMPFASSPRGSRPSQPIRRMDRERAQRWCALEPPFPSPACRRTRASAAGDTLDTVEDSRQWAHGRFRSLGSASDCVRQQIRP